MKFLGRPNIALVAGLVLVAGCTVDFSAGDPQPDAGPTCGNGSVDPQEACDGSNFANQTCQSEGFTGGELTCTPECLLVLSDCVGGCGNGIVELSEECDEGQDNSDTTPDACRRSCVLAHCGDDVTDPQELCDGTSLRGGSCEGLGLGGGDLSCAADCMAHDVSGCDTPTQCGNGVIEPGEVCDGSELGSITCVDLGYPGGELGCRADCQALSEAMCHRGDGEPCELDAQCVSGLCLDETTTGFPQGMCSRICDDSADCASPMACGNTRSGISFCTQDCEATADCRPGYACFGLSLLGADHCAPHCETDNDCPQTQQCNPWTGLCNDTVVGAENGAACFGGDPCRGNFCSFDYPDGYCLSFCSLSSGWCPGDNVCSDLYGGGALDLGICLDGCLVQSDCMRSGYSCEPNPFGSGTVCIGP